MATVEKLIVEKEKLLKTIRSSGNVSDCSCPESEEGCINCLSNSELNALSESSSSSTVVPEPMIVAPDSCDSGTDSGNEEDDDDDDESGRLYIDTSVSDEDSKVLDLSFAKERHVQMELTDSDSQPSSSQESATSQECSLNEETKPVVLFPNQKPSKIPESFVLKDYIKEESMEMEDSDYVMSSQESSQSIYSSQDSIDGSFLKHGGRTCEVSCD